MKLNLGIGRGGGQNIKWLGMVGLQPRKTWRGSSPALPHESPGECQPPIASTVTECKMYNARADVGLSDIGESGALALNGGTSSGLKKKKTTCGSIYLPIHPINLEKSTPSKDKHYQAYVSQETNNLGIVITAWSDGRETWTLLDSTRYLFHPRDSVLKTMYQGHSKAKKPISNDNPMVSRWVFPSFGGRMGQVQSQVC